MSKLLYPINPDRIIPWNNLPDLPIRKELYYTTEVLEKLGEAKAALALLQGRSAVIPNQGLLINTISLQEAKLSSEIENIFTTDDELYRAYSDGKNIVTSPSKEVVKYREALWSGYEYLKAADAFNEDYFIKMYQVILDTKDDIRPDFVNTIIRQSGTGPNAGKVIYTPPRGQKLIKEKLDNLITFLNNDIDIKIDPLLKMIIGHYQFEVIHPFRDGNGRTGRIFNIHYLTHKGLLDYPILFISRFILEHKSEYYDGLAGISQRGNWREWILFMLTAIEQTSLLTYHKINDIVSSKDAILEYIINADKNFKTPELLLDAIFTQPFTKVKHLVDAGIYSENTARDYLNHMSDMQILEKKNIEGHHYYLNRELHRILAE